MPKKDEAKKGQQQERIHLHIDSVLVIYFFLEILCSLSIKMTFASHRTRFFFPHVKLILQIITVHIRNWGIIKRVNSVQSFYPVVNAYRINWIFDTVTSKHLTKVFSDILNFRWLAVFQEIIVIWKLCLSRWQLVHFHRKFIPLIGMGKKSITVGEGIKFWESKTLSSPYSEVN